jgi:VIT1/CCC1 family predicted Fe2+/Mn2+ transporter
MDTEFVRFLRSQIRALNEVIKVPRRETNSKSKGGSFWYQLDFRKYVRGVVYGGTDGIITIFAVVAGVSGASLSTAILLILGVATLVSDALSMAVSDYLSSTAEEDVRADKERQLSHDYEANLTLYKEKLTKIFHSRGFSPAEVDILVNIISKNKKMTVDLLLQEEERSEESASSPTLSAIYTFFSFIFFGFIPLVADILIASMGSTFFAAEHTFFTACFFSGSTLFILGTVKAKFTNKNPFSVGFQMVIIGGVAAVVAYSIAYSMSGLEHHSQHQSQTTLDNTQETINIK